MRTQQLPRLPTRPVIGIICVAYSKALREHCSVMTVRTLVPTKEDTCCCNVRTSVGFGHNCHNCDARCSPDRLCLQSAYRESLESFNTVCVVQLHLDLKTGDMKMLCRVFPSDLQSIGS